MSWTALWAIRSDIWATKRMKKDARNALGMLTKSAIEEGNPDIFRHLADGLEAMMEFARLPENAVRADVFFALEELNSSGVHFTRANLFSWLNHELDAAITKTELEAVLTQMGLAEILPAKSKKG
ncbi:MAG: hypothetical protein O3A87_06785 [Verrucomicrobia bacterium]|nr:hypothetical protein [Verrucomicrobiota bacterium]MDA1006172.1 hypothetical protein [Verrucomicrobiota bacterium]